MLNLTDENFENEIQTTEKPILVDFFAVWCPPCQVLSPILEKLESEFKKELIFAKINVDSSPKASQKYGINPIPTVILFKKGEPAGEFTGLKPEAEIREWLEKQLKENGN